MGWSSREWTGFLLRASGPLTDAATSATMRRSLHAAADPRRCLGVALRDSLSGPEPPGDSPVPPVRRALRRGEGAVGGEVRETARLLARFRRRAGATGARSTGTGARRNKVNKAVIVAGGWLPRGQRVSVEGGLYHVYNRFARGESVFADPEEAIEFVEPAWVAPNRHQIQIEAGPVGSEMTVIGDR